MDKLKDPGVILGGVDLLLIIGSFSYLNKQLEQEKAERAKLTDELKKLQTQLAQSVAMIATQPKLNKEINELVKGISEELTALRNDVDDDLDEVVSVMNEKEMTITLPSKAPPPPPPPTTRRGRQQQQQQLVAQPAGRRAASVAPAPAQTRAVARNVPRRAATDITDDSDVLAEMN